MHYLIAKAEGEHWGAYLREHATVPWSPITKSWRLAPVIDAAIEPLFVLANPADKSSRCNYLGHAFTFSERPAEAVMADLGEAADVLVTTAPSCNIEVLLPRKAYAADDRWARVMRWPNMARISSLGIATTAIGLREALRSWFGDEEQLKRFDRSNRFRQHDPYLHELYLRPSWDAGALLPDAFPPPKPPPVLQTPEQAEVTKQMLAHQRAQESARRENASHAATKAASDAWRQRRLGR
jgi:hypothetical protein